MLVIDASDMDLLGEYARNNSEQAFGALVERHVNLVHAVALRQTGHAQLAQDVTQAVFIVLAEKAASIPPNTILTGWLFRATRYAAANARRAEARREHWEQKAAQMEPTTTSPDPSGSDAEQITPLLNDALEELPERDRAAILLRFFQSKSMEEVGRTLGTSEDAAKMRLSRAVEKLRLIFRKRGVTVSAAALTGVLVAQSVQAAPAGFASSVAALAFAKQTSTSTLPIVKGTLILMASTKSKSLVIAALLLLLLGVTTVIVQQLPTGKPPSKGAVAAASVLVFRDVPSWNRDVDFEDALSSMGMAHVVKSSAEMGSIDLAPYRVVIIPGAQKKDFYQNYTAQAGRFDAYVTNGGTLVLELNGAENANLPLPRGVSMVRHGAKDNTIMVPDHPIMVPLGGRPIHANFASHGYLGGVPPGALVLVTETTDGQADPGKPTFVEYPSGAGRVIAACQCFHDRDGSGRGPLMETVIEYAEAKKWAAGTK